MSCKRLIVAIALTLFIAYSASADDLGLSDRYSACLEQSGGVTVNILNCISTETERQDNRLNKAYKKIMENLSPDRKKQLRSVQRLWIKYRDANCGFYADPNGGTIASINSSECFLVETAGRAKELENLIIP